MLPSLPSKNQLLAGLDTVKTSSASGDVQYMKMDKTGCWVFGADEIEIEDGAKWLVNPAIYKGYIAWVDNAPAGEEMAMVGVEPPVIKANLEQGMPWQEQLGLQMICVSGEDAGTQVLFKSSSKGGMDAIAELSKEIKRQIQSGEDYMPVVTLTNDSYKHKKYGKIYTPVLEVSAWTDGEQYEKYMDGAVEEDEVIEVEAAAVEEVEEEVAKPKTKTKTKTRSRARAH